MLAPCVRLKHGHCLHSATGNAEAKLAVFTESAVAPKLIARDLRYTLCANVKTLNQFQLELAVRSLLRHAHVHIYYELACMRTYTQAFPIGATPQLKVDDIKRTIQKEDLLLPCCFVTVNRHECAYAPV